MPAGSIRVVRIISRLNVGGPSIQAITLTKALEALGYETLLVRGTEAPREGSMDALAESLGVTPRRVPALGRELGPQDLRALAAVTAVLREVRPDILHTHAAKAGTIGRVAALLSGRHAPRVRVHTFHGHVLSGYFSRPRASLFRLTEQALARTTTRLIAVSPEVRDDLIRLRVAPPSRVTVVPLGFDLSAFGSRPEERSRTRAAVRRRWGVPAEARVVTLVARLVPIKRVDRFLDVARRLTDLPDARFVVVGDGELAADLMESPVARQLAPRLTWAGLETDMPSVMSASDVVMLTSDNEGTPVSLIEAQAAGVPVVSTRVGGVASAVLEGQSGFLAEPHDADALQRSVRTLVHDEEMARAFGEAGRRYARDRFSLDRLVSDIDSLYRELLGGA